MGDTFQRLFDNWIVMIVLIVCTMVLLASVVEEIRKYACHRKDVELKRDLVDRGMSADEIERVVAVKSPRDK